MGCAMEPLEVVAQVRRTGKKYQAVLVLERQVKVDRSLSEVVELGEFDDVHTALDHADAEAATARDFSERFWLHFHQPPVAERDVRLRT